MVELTKNQKIFFGGLTVLIVAVICYYIMTKSTLVDYTEIDAINNYVVEQEEQKNKDIVIHITGAVVNEGIVTVKEGSRISDVIEAAGGYLTTADFSKVNLAYIVLDGQKIYIPSIEDIEEIKENEYISNSSGNNVIIEDASPEKTVKGDVKVNINTANETELETLSGIGKATAAKIIEYREENGKFNSIEDIKNVNGIGEAKFSNIKEKITI